MAEKTKDEIKGKGNAEMPKEAREKHPFKEKHEEKHDEKHKKHAPEMINAVSIVRIVSSDIPGEMNVYTGLTRIKGVSWSFANALCHTLGIDKKRKVLSLTPEEIEKITNFIKQPSLPAFLLNRRRDIATGKDMHLITSDLDFQHEFDIRRMKKMRGLRGWRHALGQPVRGQRTKSHFRKGRALGVHRSKSMIKPQKEEGKKKEKKEKKQQVQRKINNKNKGKQKLKKHKKDKTQEKTQLKNEKTA